VVQGGGKLSTPKFFETSVLRRRYREDRLKDTFDASLRWKQDLFDRRTCFGELWISLNGELRVLNTRDGLQCLRYMFVRLAVGADLRATCRLECLPSLERGRSRTFYVLSRMRGICNNTII